jgi:hypothetical protein
MQNTMLLRHPMSGFLDYLGITTTPASDSTDSSGSVPASLSPNAPQPSVADVAMQSVMEPVASGPVTDASTMLSAHYSLGNLTATQQQLTRPNMPSTQEEMDNLSILANDLEELAQAIGPFNLLSGYRTQELQTVLGKEGNPVSRGLSFHELGRAVDLFPTTMSVQEFIARLLANESLKIKFAEIAMKPTQNAIHLSVNVPSDTRAPKILALNDNGVYVPMSDVDIETMIAPFIPTPELRTAIVVSNAEARSAGLTMPIVLAVAAIGLFLFTRKK